MIKLTKLNGGEIYINAELIETIETTPDTVITLTTGKKYVVLDKAQDVVQLVIEYRKKVFSNILNADLVKER